MRLLGTDDFLASISFMLQHVHALSEYQHQKHAVESDHRHDSCTLSYISGAFGVYWNSAEDI